MKKRALIAALALLLLGTAAVFVRGRARVLADAQGKIRGLAVSAAGVFWIVVPEGPGAAPVRVRHLAHGSRDPVTLLEAYDVRSLFAGDHELYALVENGPDDDSGELVVRSLSGGTERRRASLYSPHGLWADEGSLFWTETRSARVAAIPHVPALRPVSAIRVARGVGSQPELLALVESWEDHYDGQLLGVDDGQLYWTERVNPSYPSAALLVNRAAPGGERETPVYALGPNAAALGDDDLYWTARSEDLNVPSAARVTRRLDLRKEQASTITDWLSPGGALLVEWGRVYYVGGRRLWSVPRTLGRAVPLAKFGQWAPDAPAIYRHNVYCADTVEGAVRIVRRPVSWRGYLGAALPTRRAKPSVAAGGEGR